MFRYILYLVVILVAGSLLLEVFKDDILKNISVHLVNYRFLICGALGFSLFYIFSEGLKNKEKRSAFKFKLSIFIFIVLSVSFLLNFLFMNSYYRVYDKFYDNLFIYFLIGFAIAIIFQQFSIWSQQKVTSQTAIPSTLEREKRSDIRDFAKSTTQKMPIYDPKKYFKKDAFFLALDENDQPIYWTEETLPHIQVCGATGCGKGVFLGSMAAQCLYKDEAVFIMDPKRDKWLPAVAHQAAQDMGKESWIVDLNKPVYQFNMFEDVTEAEQFEMLCAGFELVKTGQPGPDFYVPAKRKIADFVSKNWHVGQTAEGFNAEYANFLEKESIDFAQSFSELSALKSVNAKQGLSLKKIVENGGIVYFIGSMRNAAVRMAQKMLLVRLVQIAESRDRVKGNIRPICVVLDELKYHISRPALEALGAARDKGLHIIMAHQSQADLKDCPQDLNAEAIEGAVTENSTIKLIYRVEMPATAKVFAEKSGTILVDDEIRTVERSLSLAESVSSERKVSQSETTLIDVNRLLTFPQRSGALFGVGLAKSVYTSAYITKQNYEALQITDQSTGDEIGSETLDFGKL